MYYNTIPRYPNLQRKTLVKHAQSELPSELEHGLSVCMINNPPDSARGLFLRTGGRTMSYLTQLIITTVLPNLRNWQADLSFYYLIMA